MTKFHTYIIAVPLCMSKNKFGVIVGFKLFEGVN